MTAGPAPAIESHSHYHLECPLVTAFEPDITSYHPEIMYMKYKSTSGALWLVASCNNRVIKTNTGPLVTPRLSLCCDGTSYTYDFQVMFCTIASGPVDVDRLKHLLSQPLPGSNYVLCLGIGSYPEDIRFQIKNLHNWGKPFH